MTDTPQSYIDAIGEAITDVEEKSEAVRAAARASVASVKRLHDVLEKAQAAYAAENGNVVAFSGGIDKPPVP